MPRYYFHVRDGEKFELDPEGGDFADVDHARDEAILAAREMMAARVAAGEKINGQVFEITSEDGSVVARLPLRSVVYLD